MGAEVIAEFQDVEGGRKADCSAGPVPRQARDPADRQGHRLARSIAFIYSLMEGGVDFVAADMPSVNRLTLHMLAAVAKHEREMISQRTKAPPAAAKLRGTQLGNPRLPPAGMHASATGPSTPGGVARVALAQERAVAAFSAVIAAAHAADAHSLGDYVQSLQAAQLPAARGGERWSRLPVARVLRSCGATAT